MTRHYLGLAIIVIGMLLIQIRIYMDSQMQRTVAKFSPPKTGRTLKSILEALNRSRTRSEYKRLFPDRAEKKFLTMRVMTVAGMLCIAAGIILAG